MSTDTIIGVIRNDGSVDTIHCYYDAYIEHSGVILQEHYQDIDKINKLINLGDLCLLEKEVEPNENEKHTYKYPQDNVTVAYGRDRGDSDTQSKHFESVEAFNEDYSDNCYKFAYLYDEKKGKWYCNNPCDDSLEKFIELEKGIELLVDNDVPDFMLRMG